jgi:outer membrane immunogenic protein
MLKPIELFGRSQKGNLMRGLILGAASAIALLSSANAADMYVAAPAGPGGYKDAPYVMSWAGYYAGVNVGGSWMHNDATWQGTTPPFPPSTTFKAQLDDSSVIGGGQLGRNWQFGSIVAGIETDFALRRLEASASTVVLNAVPVTLTEKQDWVGTVRGRLGYAMGSWLVYGTGGFAYGGLTHHVAEGGVVLATNSSLREGWAAGGGVEWAIKPRWSIGAEYLHVDLGSVNVLSAVGISTTRFEDQSDMVRAKLNYHFASGYVPLK